MKTAYFNSVPNLFHSLAPDQYTIISMSYFQILLLVVMNSIMVLVATGQERFMEIFQFVDM